MDDPPVYTVEIEGIDDPAGTSSSAVAAGRRWLGVRFDCCGVYQRVYCDPEGTAYRGRCPRCLRALSIRVGPDGTRARFFAAE